MGVSPRPLAAKALRAALRLARSTAQRLSFQYARFRESRVDAIQLAVLYDLNRLPISYDICWVLMAADIERRRLNLPGLHLILAPFAGRFVHSMPPGHPDYVSEEAILWRIDNIVVSIARLLPSCAGITLCSSRSQAGRLVAHAQHSWPETRLATTRPQFQLRDAYRLVTGELTPSGADWGFCAPAQGLNYVRQWAAKIAGRRRLVVITLRQHKGGALRNNNLDAWIAFARRMDPEVFCPVFVPDTDHALAPAAALAEFAVFPEASWNMGLRLALYETAYLNMFVNNGPASLCMLNPRCRYLMFKVMVPSVHLTSAETLSDLGFKLGATPKFASPFQKWVWQDDGLKAIESEFALMSTLIENGVQS